MEPPNKKQCLPSVSELRLPSLPSLTETGLLNTQKVELHENKSVPFPFFKEALTQVIESTREEKNLHETAHRVLLEKMTHVSDFPFGKSVSDIFKVCEIAFDKLKPFIPNSLTFQDRIFKPLLSEETLLPFPVFINPLSHSFCFPYREINESVMSQKAILVKLCPSNLEISVSQIEQVASNFLISEEKQMDKEQMEKFHLFNQKQEQYLKFLQTSGIDSFEGKSTYKHHSLFVNVIFKKRFESTLMSKMLEIRGKQCSFTFADRVRITLDILYGLKNLHAQNITLKNITPSHIALQEYDIHNSKTFRACLITDVDSLNEIPAFGIYSPPEAFGISSLSKSDNLNKDYDLWATGCLIHFLQYEKNPEWCRLITELQEKQEALQIESTKTMSLEDWKKTKTDSTYIEKKKNLLLAFRNHFKSPEPNGEKAVIRSVTYRLLRQRGKRISAEEAFKLVQNFALKEKITWKEAQK